MKQTTPHPYNTKYFVILETISYSVFQSYTAEAKLH